MHYEPTPPTPASRDDVLLWLNDRLGKSVAVAVELEKGDYSVSVLEAAGELRHWRRDRREWWTRTPRDDVMGLYEVGEASFDLSDLDHLAAWVRADGIVDVELAEDVTLRIVERATQP